MVMKWVELGLHLIWASRKRPKGFCVENQNPRSYGQKHVIKQSEQTLSRCLHIHPPFLHRPPLCSQPRPGQNGECLSNSQIFVLISIWFRFVLFSSVWIWIISIFIFCLAFQAVRGGRASRSRQLRQRIRQARRHSRCHWSESGMCECVCAWFHPLGCFLRVISATSSGSGTENLNFRNLGRIQICSS